MTKQEVAAKMKKTISPSELAMEKLNVYQSYCLEILNKAVTAFVELDAESVIEDLTFDSPAGDSYGLYNRPLNFGFNRPMDICEAIEYLEKLSLVASGDMDPDKLDDY